MEITVPARQEFDDAGDRMARMARALRAAAAQLPGATFAPGTFAEGDALVRAVSDHLAWRRAWLERHADAGDLLGEMLEISGGRYHGTERDNTAHNEDLRRRLAHLHDGAPSTTSAAGRSTVDGIVVDGFAAGTTGGGGGRTVTARTVEELRKYASSDEKLVIQVAGNLSLSGQIRVASNKTIIGLDGASITGGGLMVKGADNVIIANMKISKAVGTDAVTVEGSTHVVITSNDFSSDRNHGKDYYDGLVDIVKGSDLVTVSGNTFSNHEKVMLIGHSDDNGAQDSGHLRVTIHDNTFTNVGSRLPSIRFGTAEVYNNTFNGADSAVNSRMGATVVAHDNTFTDVKKPFMSAFSRQPGTIIQQ